MKKEPPTKSVHPSPLDAGGINVLLYAAQHGDIPKMISLSGRFRVRRDLLFCPSLLSSSVAPPKKNHKTNLPSSWPQVRDGLLQRFGPDIFERLKQGPVPINQARNQGPCNAPYAAFAPAAAAAGATRCTPGRHARKPCLRTQTETCRVQPFSFPPRGALSGS